MSDDGNKIAWAFLLLFILIGGALTWDWYRSGVQVEVYKRQGVTMTQWEVFMGAKPVERYMQSKGQP